jgi:putative transcriptional regulator
MTSLSADLTNHFLIAMPNMVDPNFSRTLTYIAEHNERGALGLIVNRPIDMNLAGLFERIDVPLEHKQLDLLPVYFGGPVQTDRGFVLHRPSGESRRASWSARGLSRISRESCLRWQRCGSARALSHRQRPGC